MAHVLGSWEEAWLEYLAPGFDLAKPYHYSHLASELRVGNSVFVSPSLSFNLSNKIYLNIHHKTADPKQEYVLGLA